ncbi:type I-F CRISPR-associated endoribonuclease Cas6/Csy4 [Brenneria roseae subsp. americana]|uniref:Type I-F CRISPR-associated endoribonuclease Cas6/Csy4 n=1 Tax=Brenneria roseae subsp. americana TaxID=1508507 RepID=A0A2U1U2A2_9GAMM|nr:type I-F CRISPR-associated endoribonuclease Cas6/Csy4 [Brenneria roseae]PWC15763.1 type I-F CRISPR-associated endoribonuclease Cas6/Csy4 [Brenneria roseae subsp. americana]
MDHYIDIRVLPDLEFKAPQLLNALFAKLHRALGLLADGSIGVSFPEVGKTLGECLRLHGTATALSTLEQTGWLKGLRDYTRISELQAVPDGVKFRTVRRVQVKSSAERLRRRSVNKGWLTAAEAAVRIPDAVEKRSKLPFVQLKSLSSGQMFRLFVEHGPLQDIPVAGHFSFYGLSTETTIPWF